ncbi:rod shape-determining protein MreC [[Leptolyngbya] sp. PCC 7376]|uniref:rod shape-determining protein MreC n=1 Tax=[Leptolyngbya] sp. PCC 7376 TaxID=111781 RepID=UPI001CECCE8D|nr:rod shape-determining protein MreC [[Leptolyngbya] sp. PCC 7376]
MFSRWWQRNGFTIVFVGIGLSAVFFLRQTQGGIIQEFYALLANTSGAASAPVDEEILLQNSKLRELQNRVEELEQQNKQLKSLLDFSKELDMEVIAAPVIGRSADSWWQQITIGKGSNEGIKVGDIVSGIGGLVGRVTQVTPNSSRVMLISDANQQIGVMVTRSRHQAYLKGQSNRNNQQMAQMTFYQKVPDVEEGDLVTTSNLSVLYPPGVPIGKVVKVDKKGGPAPIATVELSASFTVLEWVMVSSFEQKPLDFEPLPEQNVEEEVS